MGTTAILHFPEQNDWGLCDIVGNVWEWVADGYDANYYETLPLDTPTVDPKGPGIRENRVLRGGTWVGGPKYLRASTRCSPCKMRPGLGGDENGDVGFRCAKD